MQSEKRKQKRVVENSIKKRDILCVKRNGYIGSMYVNGVTLELTTTSAVLSRAYIYNVFLLGSVNYSMLRYIYELNAKPNRTEEEEQTLLNGKSFIRSFVMQDFAAGSSSGLVFNNEMYGLFLAKINQATQEELLNFYAAINLTIKNSAKIDNGEIDQSDLESEAVEIKNMLDLNHVHAGFNMIDSLPDETPSDEAK